METDTDIPTGGKAAARPRPYSDMEESTQEKMLSAPKPQENIHLEPAPSWHQKIKLQTTTGRNQLLLVPVLKECFI